MVMRKIHLYGRLRKEFGPVFELDVLTAGEAIRALNANFPGRFRQAMENGCWSVLHGQRKGGLPLEVEDINTFGLGRGDIHIVPVAAGSKRGGVLKAILGVVLIGAAIFLSGGTLAAPLAGMGGAIPGLMGLTYGNVALIGLGLALAGASQLLTKSEKSQDETKKDESFTFSGPGNGTEQGNAVPLIYGRVLTGSLLVSASMDSERFA